MIGRNSKGTKLGREQEIREKIETFLAVDERGRVWFKRDQAEEKRGEKKRWTAEEITNSLKAIKTSAEVAKSSVLVTK